MAAGASNSSVLPMVVQAYRKAKLLPTALKTSNGRNLLPLYIAIQSANYENTVFLMKECEEHCPETLQPTDEGVHMAQHFFPSIFKCFCLSAFQVAHCFIWPYLHPGVLQLSSTSLQNIRKCVNHCCLSSGEVKFHCTMPTLTRSVEYDNTCMCVTYVTTALRVLTTVD